MIGSIGTVLALGLAGCAEQINSRASGEGSGTGTPQETGTARQTMDELNSSTETLSEGGHTTDEDAATPEEQTFEVDEPSLGINTSLVPDDATLRTYPTLGSADAPVEVTFYGGWKCPYTQKFVTNLLPVIVRRFVVPGDLRIVFQPVVYENGEPFHGFDEVRVARAGFAVWERTPEEFWTYFEYFYANQVTEDGWYSPERVLKVAQAAGSVDEATLRKAMKSKRYTDRIAATMKQVRSIPIKAVPRLVIDDEVYAPTVRKGETIQALAETTGRQPTTTDKNATTTNGPETTNRSGITLTSPMSDATTSSATPTSSNATTSATSSPRSETTETASSTTAAGE